MPGITQIPTGAQWASKPGYTIVYGVRYGTYGHYEVPTNQLGSVLETDNLMVLQVMDPSQYQLHNDPAGYYAGLPPATSAPVTSPVIGSSNPYGGNENPNTASPGYSFASGATQPASYTYPNAVSMPGYVPPQMVHPWSVSAPAGGGSGVNAVAVDVATATGYTGSGAGVVGNTNMSPSGAANGTPSSDVLVSGVLPSTPQNYFTVLANNPMWLVAGLVGLWLLKGK